MRHTHKKSIQKPCRAEVSDYVLSIKLPNTLVKAIDHAARAQYRTRASVIRETLAEKFKEVA